MATYVGEVTREPEFEFSLSQRDIDLLISFLHDIVRDGAELRFNDTYRYRPNQRTLQDLKEILDCLNEVGMHPTNDYLSNFTKVN